MKINFIRLKTLDPECRCCGKGSQHVCEKCDDMLHDGYAFFIEVKDNATPDRKKPTGYSIAMKANQVSECIMRETGEHLPMNPGIYFIRQTDLKEFLKDEYNNPRAVSSASRVNGRLLSSAPRRVNTEPQPAAGTRQAVELRHR